MKTTALKHAIACTGKWRAYPNGHTEICTCIHQYIQLQSVCKKWKIWCSSNFTWKHMRAATEGERAFTVVNLWVTQSVEYIIPPVCVWVCVCVWMQCGSVLKPSHPRRSVFVCARIFTITKTNAFACSFTATLENVIYNLLKCYFPVRCKLVVSDQLM